MRLIKTQRGGAILLLLAGMAVLAVIAVLGSTLLSSLIGGSRRSSLNVQTGQILTQAAYTLINEANTSASLPVSTAPSAWPAGVVPVSAPVQGTAAAVGMITSTSAAPKIDAWGSTIGYCTFTPTSQASPVFAIISAGPDRVFETSCTQAFAGTPQGDDGVRWKTATNVQQGVGGTIYYKDPVPNEAGLSNITAPVAGEIRYVISDQSSWTNPTGTAGAAGITWFPSQGVVPNVAAGGACSLPAGTLGKDTLGNIYSCQ